MVEHTAVNRGVVGSSPTRGVKLERVRNRIRLLGQAVKTSPFHGGNTGSIPVGVTEAGLVPEGLSVFLIKDLPGSLREQPSWSGQPDYNRPGSDSRRFTQ